MINETDIPIGTLVTIDGNAFRNEYFKESLIRQYPDCLTMIYTIIGRYCSFDGSTNYRLNGIVEKNFGNYLLNYADGITALLSTKDKGGYKRIKKEER